MTLLSEEGREHEQYDKIATNKMNDLETLPKAEGGRCRSGRLAINAKLVFRHASVEHTYAVG
jgi:hypothetical protein